MVTKVTGVSGAQILTVDGKEIVLAGSAGGIRQEIYNILFGVTNIGKVYDYERWAADWTSFIGYFKTTIASVDQIRGWEISRRRLGEKKVVLGGSSLSHEKTHVFMIRGYMSINDATTSEKTFDVLLDIIGDAFRTKKTLNGTVKDHDYIQVETVEARMFGGVLCHFAELSLTVYERI